MKLCNFILKHGAVTCLPKPFPRLSSLLVELSGEAAQQSRCPEASAVGMSEVVALFSEIFDLL